MFRYVDFVVLMTFNPRGNSSTHTSVMASLTETSAGHGKTSAGHRETSAGHRETSAGHTKISAGQTETNARQTETIIGQTETSTGQAETNAGQTETSTGRTETSAGWTNNRTIVCCTFPNLTNLFLIIQFYCYVTFCGLIKCQSRISGSIWRTNARNTHLTYA